MTEVKWSILFTALFLALSFGLEYEIQLEKRLAVTKIQYNLQLDTCLTDTLRKSEMGNQEGAYFFYNPQRVRKELEQQIKFMWPGFSSERADRGNGRIALLILYEPDGFYFYEAGMQMVSEKVNFLTDEAEERISQLETFMEGQLKERLVLDGKKGSLCFTFPKEERASYAQTIKGTGLLLVYEAAESYFKGRPYERFLLSGARAEDIL